MTVTMRLAALLTTLGFVYHSAPEVQSQAWTRDAGSVYVNVSYRSLAADQFYSPEGTLRDLPSTYRQHSLSLYSEVGVIDRWLTATVDGELFRRNQLDDQGATTGMGDMHVGLWSGLLQAPFHLALGTVVGIPTGDADPDSGTDDPFAEIIADSLPTGDEEIDVAFKTALGHSFGGTSGWPLSHYALGEVGYWLRTEGFADAITYRVELGTRIARPQWDRFLVIGRVLGVSSLQADGAVGSFSGLGDGVSYSAWGAELAVRTIDTLNVSVGYETAFDAQNAPSGAVFKFGLGWEH